MIRTKGEKIFSFFNTILMVLISIVMLYPVVYVLSVSVSNPWSVETGQVMLFPKGINLEAYKEILGDERIWIAYANSIFITVAGTLVNMIMTICTAYPLSREQFTGRKLVTFLILLSMWFSGGLIPTYLNIQDLGLYNTRTAILIAFAVGTSNVIILRTFFQSIPKELEESAKLDGATEMQTLVKIFLPLSGAALATISLFYAVGRWNGYFWNMILLRDENKIPLQVLLKTKIVEMQNLDENTAIVTPESLVSQTTLIYTTIVVSMVPMLAIYPFIQKHFVKGVMMGSIKG